MSAAAGGTRNLVVIRKSRPWRSHSELVFLSAHQPLDCLRIKVRSDGLCCFASCPIRADCGHYLSHSNWRCRPAYSAFTAVECGALSASVGSLAPPRLSPRLPARHRTTPTTPAIPGSAPRPCRRKTPRRHRGSARSGPPRPECPAPAPRR